MTRMKNYYVVHVDTAIKPKGQDVLNNNILNNRT